MSVGREGFVFREAGQCADVGEAARVICVDEIRVYCSGVGHIFIGVSMHLLVGFRKVS